MRGEALALGKFAGYPEFLRADGEGGAVDRLDEWLDEGMQLARERGAAWTSAFLMGAAYGFLWRARPGESDLCGVLAPSRDAIGRDYPLVVATRVALEGFARAPHVVPLTFGDFLDEAYRVVDEARSTLLTVAELNAKVRALGTVAPEDTRRTETEYAEWSARTRLGEAWGAVFPGGRPLEQAAHVLEAIAPALAALTGRRDLRGLVVRLPLGVGGVAAAALWIDVVCRMCGPSPTLPSAFWSVDREVVFLSLGDVPATVLGELWAVGSQIGPVYEASGGPSPWSRQGAAPPQPGRILLGLGSEQLMSVFLDALSR